MPKLSKEMLDELKNIILNSKTFPSETDLKDKKRKTELASFKKAFTPKYNHTLSSNDVMGFISRYGLIDLFDDYFSEFKDKGKRIIIVEGADVTGKTSLVRQLSKEIGGFAIKNQSENLFKHLFGFPRTYKSTIVDYNKNANVALLFYFVLNLYTIDTVLKNIGSRRSAVIDSFILRTVASHIAHPGTGKNKLVMNKGIKNIVEKGLNKSALKIMQSASSILFIVFLYASAEAGFRQSMERKGGNDYDTNPEYWRIVSQQLKMNQEVLRKNGVKVFSLVTVAENEKNESISDMDAIFVRSNDADSDIYEKSRLIADAMRKSGLQ